MADDLELTIPEAAKRLGISVSQVRRLIKAGKLPASLGIRDGKDRYLVNCLNLFRYHNFQGQKPKKQLSFERTLATFMSIQRPIEEMRLSEVLKPLDSDQHSMLRDPSAFDHLFKKLYGWDAIGNDRYKFYKEWLQCDGDLAYLVWLEDILKAGDDVVGSLRKDRWTAARISQWTKELQAFLNSPFMDYLAPWLVLNTAQSIKDSPPPTDEWLNQMAPKIKRDGILRAFAYWLYHSLPEKQKRAQPGLKRFVLSIPYGELLWEYGIEPELRRKPENGGRPPDYWGTFFLMALSAHLSENNKPPHYTLCCTLLNLFRGKNEKKSDSLVQTKIEQLQASHSNWPQHLASIRQIFLASLTH